uniref:Putative endodeoxyribonuclease n=1 Tax=viral metagenome TaxID=1070528 RepID=A0A6H1ZE74_9ZZZZ
MTLSFTIPGQIRIKKNRRRIYGSGRNKVNLPSELYMEWQNKARFHFLKIGGFGFEPFTSNCHVKAVMFYESHQPDLSGCLESVGDCFEKMIWKNDKQIKSWDGSRVIQDKDNPRTEIIVEW